MKDNQIIKEFKHLIRNKEFSKVEELWIELMGRAELDLDQFFEIGKLLGQNSEQSFFLLSLLADHFREIGDLDALKRTLIESSLYKKDERRLRQEIIGLYHKTTTNPFLDYFLYKTGLLENREIGEACKELDSLLDFDIGKYVNHPDYGLGKIETIDTTLDRVLITFVANKFGNRNHLPQKVNFDFPKGIKKVTVLAPNHFLALKLDTPDELSKQALENPLSVFTQLLKSLLIPLKPKEIREYFQGIVIDWSSFWEKLRRQIVVKGEFIRTSKENNETVYEWCETSGIKIGLTHFNKGRIKGGLVPDAEFLLNASEEEIIALIEETKSFQARRKILEQIKKRNDSEFVSRVERVVFYKTPDKRLLKMLLKAHPELIKETITQYLSYPFQFLLLAEMRTEFGIKEKDLIFRLIDLLESERHKEFRSKVKTLLIRKEFLRNSFSEMDSEDREMFKRRIESCKNLADYQKDEIRIFLKEDYPEIFKLESDSRVIFNTLEGIEKQRKEYNYLLTNELPKVREEVARARSYGDLSENYEYKAAKEKQARMLRRLDKMKEELALARPIDFNKITGDKVEIGTKVRLMTGESETIEWTILGPWDSDPDKGVISYLAPFAKALLGKKVGEIVENPENPQSKGYKIIGISVVSDP